MLSKARTIVKFIAKYVFHILSIIWVLLAGCYLYAAWNEHTPVEYVISPAPWVWLVFVVSTLVTFPATVMYLLSHKDRLQIGGFVYRHLNAYAWISHFLWATGYLFSLLLAVGLLSEGYNAISTGTGALWAHTTISVDQYDWPWSAALVVVALSVLTAGSQMKLNISYRLSPESEFLATVSPFKNTWELHWPLRQNISDKAPSLARDLRKAMRYVAAKGMLPERLVLDSHLLATFDEKQIETVLMTALPDGTVRGIKIEPTRRLNGLSRRLAIGFYKLDFGEEATREFDGHTRRVTVRLVKHEHIEDCVTQED